MVTLTRTSPRPHPQGYICSFPWDTQVVSDIETSPWGSICFPWRGQRGPVIRSELDPTPLRYKLVCVYARAERAVNNKRVMPNMKPNRGADTLHSFLFVLYESMCSQSIKSQWERQTRLWENVRNRSDGRRHQLHVAFLFCFVLLFDTHIKIFCEKLRSTSKFFFTAQPL